MLPIPARQYIPKAYRDTPALKALAAKMDKSFEQLKDDATEAGQFINIDRVPSVALNALGNMLEAGLLRSDTERTKRQKIEAAIASHKNRGTWKFDVKPKIDIIAGGNAKLITGIGSEEWIVVGDGLTPDSYDWALLGGNGEDEWGLAVLGGSTEPEVLGNVYIDTDDPGITSDQLDNIELSIADSIPAYFRIVLTWKGYAEIFDTDGNRILDTDGNPITVYREGERVIG